VPGLSLALSAFILAQSHLDDLEAGHGIFLVAFVVLVVKS
jgi:hypothetical protein